MAGMKFSREHNRVIVDAHGLMIAEIREVWNSDRARNREKATAIISYVHLAAQIDSEAPFFNAKDDEVKALASQNIWRNNPPRALENYDITIEAYQKAYETADVRIVKSFTRKIDQMKTLMDDTAPKIEENIHPVSGATTFASNTKIITDIMGSIDVLMNEREKLEQRIKRQAQQGITTLGAKKPSRLEQRLINKRNDR